MKKKKSIKFTDTAGSGGLGKRLKELRQARAVSQKELARMAKVSQATIAQIEVGRKDPSVTTLRKIAQALDMHIATLFVDGDVHVFDLPRLRRKYKNSSELTGNLYKALSRVVEFARELGLVR